MSIKILVIGSLTGRMSGLYDHLSKRGIDVKYQPLPNVNVGKLPDMAVLDDLFPADFSALEDRFANALIYGTSHPEIYDLPLAKGTKINKKPKGPRDRWGKL